MSGTLRHKILNIPLLFIVMVMMCFLLESMLLAVIILIALLFYLAMLPSHDTVHIALLLPCAYLFSLLLGYSDHEVKSFSELFKGNNLVASIMYTFGAFLIIAPVRLLQIHIAARYLVLLAFAITFALLTRKPATGIDIAGTMAGFYFLFLAVINGIIDLIKSSKALPIQ